MSAHPDRKDDDGRVVGETNAEKEEEVTSLLSELETLPVEGETGSSTAMRAGEQTPTNNNTLMLVVFVGTNEPSKQQILLRQVYRPCCCCF